ncbi:MATE family efflux transporter [Agilicoccus flavus]|uniref:MATE family efflux transporter n=1 Tax=Agilicoccus flavus TaxID=2775968 RepID=UPI001CF675B9|nr:MATE family efflux transporter [Agilicoccus flavus]
MTPPRTRPPAAPNPDAPTPDASHSDASTPGTDPAPASAPVSQSREILRLAVPAFLALVAEPLFLLADSAIVGHLGTAPLAGLGAAAAALATAANLFVFLAYGTTALVARRLGAGQLREAIASGLDGLWLALGLGLATAAGLAAAAGPIIGAFGLSGPAAAAGVTYLRISAIGVPAMLVVLAMTGVLRGLQDTRTPLIAATLGFGANIVLNVALVYGAGLGIAGSAWGTVIAQSGMALGLVAVVLPRARALGAAGRPHPERILEAARTGIPLFVRTVALRAAILLTTWVAARTGDAGLAAVQVAVTVWTFLAFALDALAIAGQALTGRGLGAGDVRGVRSSTHLMVQWGIAAGTLLGAAVALLAPWLPALFTTDPAVYAALTAGLLVVGLATPISGYVFVLDGVLIGAGDTRWLAGAQTVILVLYAPVALLVAATTGPLIEAGGVPLAVAVVWVAFTVFMVLRAVALRLRVHTDGWLVTGARATRRA